MKNNRKFFLLISLILFFSCFEKKSELEEFGYFTFIPAEYKIERSGDLNEHFIGRIRDITTDQDGNLYVLDNEALNVKKYDREGQMIKIFGIGRGKGPGEFVNPISVAVDSSDNVYVADMGNNNVNVFSPNNVVINQFSTEFVPARIIVDRESNLFLIGFSMSYQGDLIQKYVLNNENEYKKTITFGERPKDFDNNLLSRAGNVDVLGLSDEGYLYLSMWFPYEVRKYALDGELLSTYSRDISFFKEPSYDSRGVVKFSSGSWGILPISEEIVINQIFNQNNGERTYYYDFIDLKSGKHIGLISEIESSLPPEGGLIAIDRKKNIFIATNYPNPNIFKFKLKKDG